MDLPRLRCDQLVIRWLGDEQGSRSNVFSSSRTWWWTSTDQPLMPLTLGTVRFNNRCIRYECGVALASGHTHPLIPVLMIQHHRSSDRSLTMLFARQCLPLMIDSVSQGKHDQAETGRNITANQWGPSWSNSITDRQQPTSHKEHAGAMA